MEDTKLITKDLLTHLGYWLILVLSYNETLIPPAWIRGFSINIESGYIFLPLIIITIFMIVNSVNLAYERKGKLRELFNKSMRESNRLISTQEKEVRAITKKNYKIESVNLKKDGGYIINAGKFLDSTGKPTENITIKIKRHQYYITVMEALAKTIKESKKSPWIVHFTTIHGVLLGLEDII